MRRLAACCLLLAPLVGCVTVDESVDAARSAVLAGAPEAALPWGETLAADSAYSKSLGTVEAGRLALLAGDPEKAEGWFRVAVDTAVDRKEAAPKIKLGDVGNAVLAATVTDDRMQDYHLAPYELNLALEYGILAALMNGRIEDALVDARLAVYVQDSLAKTYGEDLEKARPAADGRASTAGERVCASESAALQEMMAASRNSWENPVLWWLTGALFEANDEPDMAVASYRKAAACRPGNPVFAKAAAAAERGPRRPQEGCAKLLVIYEEGLVPRRVALKIPVPLYTAMSIDIPTYGDKAAYVPGAVAVSGPAEALAAAPGLDVRALAARDLSERLPGVVVRNITRAGVQAGLQAAVNAGGNEYARLAAFAANAVVSALRRADTRSWATLPDGQQVAAAEAMPAGEHALSISANGRTASVRVALAAGDVKLLWIADAGALFRTAVVSLKP